MRAVFDGCAEIIAQAGPGADYRVLSGQAAELLWRQARQMKFIAYYEALSTRRASKSVARSMFCLALARYENPSLDFGDGDEVMRVCAAMARAHNVRLLRAPRFPGPWMPPKLFSPDPWQVLAETLPAPVPAAGPQQDS